MRRVYQDNRLEELDLATELDAAVLGDGCFKVIWDAEEHRVRVTAPDVQGIFAWWVGDDPSKVWRVASRYRIFLRGRRPPVQRQDRRSGRHGHGC